MLVYLRFAVFRFYYCFYFLFFCCNASAWKDCCYYFFFFIKHEWLHLGFSLWHAINFPAASPTCPDVLHGAYFLSNAYVNQEVVWIESASKLWLAYWSGNMRQQSFCPSKLLLLWVILPFACHKHMSGNVAFGRLLCRTYESTTCKFKLFWLGYNPAASSPANENAKQFDRIELTFDYQCRDIFCWWQDCFV